MGRISKRVSDLNQTLDATRRLSRLSGKGRLVAGKVRGQATTKLLPRFRAIPVVLADGLGGLRARIKNRGAAVASSPDTREGPSPTQRSEATESAETSSPAADLQPADSGYVNRNDQVTIGAAEPIDSGTETRQSVYVLHCPTCGLNYGANRSGIWQRKCPNHQGGAPGEALNDSDLARKP